MAIKQGFSKYNGFHFITASPMTGEPVLNLIQTRLSGNTKTGKVLQTWHLNPDMDPLEARRYGAGDERICGNDECEHRAKEDQKQGTCYVFGFVLVGLYKAYLRGRYPHWSEFGDTLAEVLTKAGSGKNVRLGAYGDPVCLGEANVAALVCEAKTFLGYTHQWKRDELAWAKEYMMASVDTPEMLLAADAREWRAFSVYSPDVAPSEALQRMRSHGLKVLRCPASKEAGEKANCNNCPIECSGKASKVQHHVMIQAHGAKPIMNRYKASSMHTAWQQQPTS